MGALCLVRRAGQPFTKPDVDVARSFADQAAAALHIGELRLDRERLRVMEDRERIARDLHDSVIQDLFAAGMSLEGVRPLITSPRAAERVAATVDQLDRTIKQVRSTIFELESSDTVGSSDELVRRVVENRGEQLGFEPKLEIDGQLAAVPATSMEHVLAVLSEGLSNVARHSGASAATVRLRISRQGGVDLQIDDDGTGFDPERVPRGNGLANMHRRAQQVRGSLEVLSNTCGTVIHLRIPSTDDRGPLGRLIDLDAMEATDAVGAVEAMDAMDAMGTDHRSPARAGVRA
jgi:signal transduction histidine kinase